MSDRSLPALLASMAIAATVHPVFAATVVGGGSSTSDCAVVLEIPGANRPAPPKAPTAVDCVDGDVACDSDGLRNGECVFPLQLCANSASLAGCTPEQVTGITVAHAVDDGIDTRFDTDFQALQSRADGLGLPTFSQDDCTLSSAVTVKLRGPDSSSRMKKNRKLLAITSEAVVAAGPVTDKDKVKFTCRPEGDGVYLPTDLYAGTFDRIRTQVFAQSCAVSACHDSEGNDGGMILLSGVAYSNLVGVTPTNNSAAVDGLDRVTPGDEDLSLLYRKIAGSLPAGYGSPMPLDAAALDPSLVELVRKWIVGDMILGPAPETGWVQGTDQ
jgi:hypothetical protein